MVQVRNSNSGASGMDLTDLRESWESFAKEDPLWAILTDPARKGGRWDEAEFFATGEREIDGVLARGAVLGVRVRSGNALDFGCGVGRLTQALCRHFERCTGVDIAPTMIETARRLNRHGERCVYVQNDRSDLGCFPDGRTDFIYSSIVLQHVPTPAAESYLREFLRILSPGGVLVFQLPSRLRLAYRLASIPIGIGKRLARVLRVSRRLAMKMRGIPQERVRALVEASGGTVVHVEPDGAAGPQWESFRYWVTK